MFFIWITTKRVFAGGKEKDWRNLLGLESPPHVAPLKI
jgi:hypothetical protein